MISISCLESKLLNNNNWYGRFQLAPFQKGEGLTVANALRRTLLAEKCNFFITWVDFYNAEIPYSVLTGMRESIFDILLNLKQVIFTSDKIIPNNDYFFKTPLINNFRTQKEKFLPLRDPSKKKSNFEPKINKYHFKTVSNNINKGVKIKNQNLVIDQVINHEENDWSTNKQANFVFKGVAQRENFLKKNPVGPLKNRFFRGPPTNKAAVFGNIQKGSRSGTGAILSLIPKTLKNSNFKNQNLFSQNQILGKIVNSANETSCLLPLGIFSKKSNLGQQFVDSSNSEKTSNPTYLGYICAKGPAIIYAKNIKLPKGLKCVDPDKYIVTLADDGLFYLRFALTTEIKIAPLVNTFDVSININQGIKFNTVKLKTLPKTLLNKETQLDLKVHPYMSKAQKKSKKSNQQHLKNSQISFFEYYPINLNILSSLQKIRPGTKRQVELNNYEKKTHFESSTGFYDSQMWLVNRLNLINQQRLLLTNDSIKQFNFQNTSIIANVQKTCLLNIQIKHYYYKCGRFDRFLFDLIKPFKPSFTPTYYNNTTVGRNKQNLFDYDNNQNILAFFHKTLEPKRYNSHLSIDYKVSLFEKELSTIVSNSNFFSFRLQSQGFQLQVFSSYLSYFGSSLLKWQKIFRSIKTNSASRPPAGRPLIYNYLQKLSTSEVAQIRYLSNHRSLKNRISLLNQKLTLTINSQASVFGLDNQTNHVSFRINSRREYINLWLSKLDEPYLKKFLNRYLSFLCSKNHILSFLKSYILQTHHLSDFLIENPVHIKNGFCYPRFRPNFIYSQKLIAKLKLLRQWSSLPIEQNKETIISLLKKKTYVFPWINSLFLVVDPHKKSKLEQCKTPLTNFKEKRGRVLGYPKNTNAFTRSPKQIKFLEYLSRCATPLINKDKGSILIHDDNYLRKFYYPKKQWSLAKIGFTSTINTSSFGFGLTHSASIHGYILAYNFISQKLKNRSWIFSNKYKSLNSILLSTHLRVKPNNHIGKVSYKPFWIFPRQFQQNANKLASLINNGNYQTNKISFPYSSREIIKVQFKPTSSNSVVLKPIYLNIEQISYILKQTTKFRKNQRINPVFFDFFIRFPLINYKGIIKAPMSKKNYISRKDAFHILVLGNNFKFRNNFSSTSLKNIGVTAGSSFKNCIPLRDPFKNYTKRNITHNFKLFSVSPKIIFSFLKQPIYFKGVAQRHNLNKAANSGFGKFQNQNEESKRLAFWDPLKASVFLGYPKALPRFSLKLVKGVLHCSNLLVLDGPTDSAYGVDKNRFLSAPSASPFLTLKKKDGYFPNRICFFKKYTLLPEWHCLMKNMFPIKRSAQKKNSMTMDFFSPFNILDKSKFNNLHYEPYNINVYNSKISFNLRYSYPFKYTIFETFLPFLNFSKNWYSSKNTNLGFLSYQKQKGVAQRENFEFDNLILNSKYFPFFKNQNFFPLNLDYIQYNESFKIYTTLAYTCLKTYEPRLPKYPNFNRQNLKKSSVISFQPIFHQNSIMNYYILKLKKFDSYRLKNKSLELKRLTNCTKLEMLYRYVFFNPLLFKYPCHCATPFGYSKRNLTLLRTRCLFNKLNKQCYLNKKTYLYFKSLLFLQYESKKDLKHQNLKTPNLNLFNNRNKLFLSKTFKFAAAQPLEKKIIVSDDSKTSILNWYLQVILLFKSNGAIFWSIQNTNAVKASKVPNILKYNDFFFTFIFQKFENKDFDYFWLKNTSKSKPIPLIDNFYESKHLKILTSSLVNNNYYTKNELLPSMSNSTDKWRIRNNANFNDAFIIIPSTLSLDFFGKAKQAYYYFINADLLKIDQQFQNQNCESADPRENSFTGSPQNFNPLDSAIKNKLYWSSDTNTNINSQLKWFYLYSKKNSKLQKNSKNYYDSIYNCKKPFFVSKFKIYSVEGKSLKNLAVNFEQIYYKNFLWNSRKITLRILNNAVLPLVSNRKYSASNFIPKKNYQANAFINIYRPITTFFSPRFSVWNHKNLNKIFFSKGRVADQFSEADHYQKLAFYCIRHKILGTTNFLCTKSYPTFINENKMQNTFKLYRSRLNTFLRPFHAWNDRITNSQNYRPKNEEYLPYSTNESKTQGFTNIFDSFFWSLDSKWKPFFSGSLRNFQEKYSSDSQFVNFVGNLGKQNENSEKYLLSYNQAVNFKSLVESFHTPEKLAFLRRSKWTERLIQGSKLLDSEDTYKNDFNIKSPLINNLWLSSFFCRYSLYAISMKSDLFLQNLISSSNRTSNNNEIDVLRENFKAYKTNLEQPVFLKKIQSRYGEESDTVDSQTNQLIRGFLNKSLNLKATIKSYNKTIQKILKGSRSGSQDYKLLNYFVPSYHYHWQKAIHFIILDRFKRPKFNNQRGRAAGKQFRSKSSKNQSQSNNQFFTDYPTKNIDYFNLNSINQGVAQGVKNKYSIRRLKKYERYFGNPLRRRINKKGLSFYNITLPTKLSKEFNTQKFQKIRQHAIKSWKFILWTVEADKYFCFYYPLFIKNCNLPWQKSKHIFYIKKHWLNRITTNYKFLADSFFTPLFEDSKSCVNNNYDACFLSILRNKRLAYVFEGPPNKLTLLLRYRPKISNAGAYYRTNQNQLLSVQYGVGREIKKGEAKLISTYLSRTINLNKRLNTNFLMTYTQLPSSLHQTHQPLFHNKIFENTILVRESRTGTPLQGVAQWDKGSYGMIGYFTIKESLNSIYKVNYIVESQMSESKPIDSLTFFSNQNNRVVRPQNYIEDFYSMKKFENIQRDSFISDSLTVSNFLNETYGFTPSKNIMLRPFNELSNSQINKSKTENENEYIQIDIWTNGELSPRQALLNAFRKLFELFYNLSKYNSLKPIEI